MYHLIDMITGNNQSLKNVGTLLGFPQVKLRTANGYIMAMIYEVLDALP